MLATMTNILEYNNNNNNNNNNKSREFLFRLYGLTRSSFKASFFSAIFCFLAALLFPPPPAVNSTLIGLSLISVLLKYSAFYSGQ
jgi:hypothetical protein